MAEKRFRALRTLATFVKLLAILVLLAGIVAGSLMLGMGSAGNGPFRDAFGGGAGGDTAAAAFAAGMAGIGTILLSVLYFVVLYGAAEGIYLLLAVEEHSRDTASLMREMWATFGPPKRSAPAGIQPIDPEIRERA